MKRFTILSQVHRAGIAHDATLSLDPVIPTLTPAALDAMRAQHGIGKQLCTTDPARRLEWKRGADVQATWRRHGWKPTAERGHALEGFLGVLLASGIGVGWAYALFIHLST